MAAQMTASAVVGLYYQYMRTGVEAAAGARICRDFMYASTMLNTAGLCYLKA